MESPDGVREHQRGVLLAVTVLVVTTAIAVVIGMLLLVGCAVKGATTGIQDSGAAPPDAPPDPDRGFESRRATTSLPPASPTTTPIPPFVPGTALCIGDSVMLGASPQYYDTLTMCGTVDATVSRAWSSAASALQGRPLPDRVVVHLGTNGYTDAGEIDAVLSQLAGVPRVVLVTVQLNGSRAWEGSVNGELHAAAGRWGNVRIADWFGASAGHPEYFSGDRIHITSSGAQAYAATIAAAL
jgi:lysophospholipase L1-like esterase